MYIYTQNSSILCSCVCCKEVRTAKGIFHHYRLSHTEQGKLELQLKSEKSKAPHKEYLKKQEEIRNQQIQIDKEKYKRDPNKCKECGENIPYEIKNNEFCSKSCVATYTNINRIRKKWTNEQKEANRIKFLSTKTKKSLTEQIQIVKLATKESNCPFSKVTYCKCSHCNTQFTNKSFKKYCDNCEHLYSHNGRAKYWFCFNVFHYPDLFDLSLITDIGFRDNKHNPNGITRDHKISVNEAIRNNYDPYYIKHPLNCELMRFDENNKKKTKCSITYEELIKLVLEYET